eukprot:scaffold2968_cov321-Pinguiococcus_pyrenoidosus.AAC.9
MALQMRWRLWRQRQVRMALAWPEAAYASVLLLIVLRARRVGETGARLRIGHFSGEAPHSAAAAGKAGAERSSKWTDVDPKF